MKKKKNSGNLDTETYIEERQCKKTAKEGGLEEFLPRGPNSADTLSLGFFLQNCEIKKFALVKPFNVWCFVTTALEN